MHNFGQLHTTTEALSERLVESFFAPNSSELKPKTTMHKSLEWGQTVHVSRYDFVDLVDSHVVGNAIDNSVLLEKIEQH